MSTEQTEQTPPKKGFKAKAKRVAVVTGSGALLIAYWLIFGVGGTKDFTDQDLRDRGNDFRAQDMEDAIFTRANVSGLDMTAIVLRKATMDSVIAEGTNLSTATFWRANLRDANLRDADLREATFEYADLTNADLRGADLRGVDFRHSNLEGADLRNTLGGPNCPERRFGEAREHCGLTAEEDNTGCCPPAFDSTEVEGMRACGEPWRDIIRAGQSQGFGILGEIQYDNVDHIDNGRFVCVE